VHALEKELAAMAPSGLVETNAGVRSCMIEYEQREMTLPALLGAIKAADAAIGNVKVGGHAGGRARMGGQGLSCLLRLSRHRACCRRALLRRRPAPDP
jgi:hypothetical protein